MFDLPRRRRLRITWRLYLIRGIRLQEMKRNEEEYGGLGTLLFLFSCRQWLGIDVFVWKDQAALDRNASLNKKGEKGWFVLLAASIDPKSVCLSVFVSEWVSVRFPIPLSPPLT